MFVIQNESDHEKLTIIQRQSKYHYHEIIRRKW